VTHYRVIETGRRCRLGEGPYWSVRQQALYWVDILGQTVFRLRPTDGSVATWQMPEMIGWLIERANSDGFVAGMQRDIVYLGLEPLSITPIARPEPDLPGNRLNDAKADARGCIWAGTVPPSVDGQTGSLYRMDPNGRVTCRDRGYMVSNGPAMSPDGRYLYHNDSRLGFVYRFELDDDGALRNRSVFLRFRPDQGAPDGMTVDSSGALWIALWGAACVSRYTADGHFDRTVKLPASQITNCDLEAPRSIACSLIPLQRGRMAKLWRERCSRSIHR
jgi:D-xylonolactonase